eukprot:scaffold81648_cov46-Prasinocladus_malaysianus.AAC.1
MGPNAARNSVGHRSANAALSSLNELLARINPQPRATSANTTEVVSILWSSWYDVVKLSVLVPPLDCAALSPLSSGLGMSSSRFMDSSPDMKMLKGLFPVHVTINWIPDMNWVASDVCHCLMAA